ncbi:hypothetical protein EDD18DRAFT_531271 [Armillaria luteobubalina]|uniref:Uncharacterized protein n=1 Tax=Armillaria luteobubalina TaxID=153913 RepID=A0AA39UJI8_9AGAR|nr:hypothetical protein EDD18DRAFT_531271 [Armillaria luteobubalina]
MTVDLPSTGETIRCGTCTFEATSDATLTRHRQETGHEPAPRRRKPRAKKSSPDSASSSPTPDIRTVADFISFYGDVPLTYNEYDLYRALVRNAQGQAPPTPPITSDTSLTANLTAAPPSRMSTSTTPALTPLVLAASVPEAPSPVMARAATPTPSPECFLAIPEEARLPPIGIGHRDYYSTAPLTAQVLQPKIPAQPSHYHRYGPY